MAGTKKPSAEPLFNLLCDRFPNSRLSLTSKIIFVCKPIDPDSRCRFDVGRLHLRGYQATVSARPMTCQVRLAVEPQAPTTICSTIGYMGAYQDDRVSDSCLLLRFLES